MKIYLSAIETAVEHSLAATRAHVQTVLTSFYYCGWKTDLGQRRASWERCLRQASLRLADSGAFTFRMAGWGTTQSREGALDVDFDAYLASYRDWLVKTARLGLVDYWVEIDIGLVTGSAWVARQRQTLIAAGLGRGMIQVWHADEHDWNDWIALLEEARSPGRSNYVAIEGHNPLRKDHQYERFIRAAYERGVKVHAFKITGHDDLQRWPFYSVDSTSWLSPTLYGCDIQLVRTGGVTHSRAKTQTPGQRKTYVGPTQGVRMDQLTRVEVLTASAKTWVTTERQLTELWVGRGVDWDKAILQPKVAIV